MGCALEDGLEQLCKVVRKVGYQQNGRANAGELEGNEP